MLYVCRCLFEYIVDEMTEALHDDPHLGSLSLLGQTFLKVLVLGSNLGKPQQTGIFCLFFLKNPMIFMAFHK